MKIARGMMGKPARITWIDPKGFRYTSSFPSDHRDLPKGRQALARWVTYGVIEDVTDGVVRIVKAVGEDPVHDSDQTHEVEGDALPEELIIEVVELVDGTRHGGAA